jgi:hypothetical protein
MRVAAQPVINPDQLDFVPVEFHIAAGQGGFRSRWLTQSAPAAWLKLEQRA